MSVNRSSSMFGTLLGAFAATAVTMIALPIALLLAQVVVVLGRAALGGALEALAVALFVGFALRFLIDKEDGGGTVAHV